MLPFFNAEYWKNGCRWALGVNFIWKRLSKSFISGVKLVCEKNIRKVIKFWKNVQKSMKIPIFGQFWPFLTDFGHFFHFLSINCHFLCVCKILLPNFCKKPHVNIYHRWFFYWWFPKGRSHCFFHFPYVFLCNWVKIRQYYSSTSWFK